MEEPLPLLAPVTSMVLGCCDVEGVAVCRRDGGGRRIWVRRLVSVEGLEDHF